MAFVFKTCEINIPINGNKLTIPIEPSVRTPQEMKDVAYEPQALTGITEPLYYMYRNIWSLNEECNHLSTKYMLRYDITVINPGKIGKEYYKTLGHFHPVIKEKNVTYPEFYEVISGQGLFLAQKIDGTDFQIIEAHKGDHVLVQPDYGHVTVNPGTEPLIVGNLVASDFNSNYEPVKTKHGLAYYILEDGIIENPHYDIHPNASKRRATPGPSIDSLFKNDPRHYERLLR
ncbi:glucose-6-phosphate isomerase [archaeon]|nr:glucose-6-phosphate isomerase [archaeon]